MNGFSRIHIGGVESFPEVKRTPSHNTSMNTPALQKVVSIAFNEEEARITLQLFDAAVRARGLDVAEVVAILAKKINNAFKEGAVGPKGEAGADGPPDGPGCRGPAGPV